jgi:dihydroorotase
VTPGLIDSHVHIYEGVGFLSIPADEAGIARGATTIIDAGSAGATTFPGFHRWIVPAETRVKALLNISCIGLTNRMELPHMSFADVRACSQIIEENRDTILGVKVRMTDEIVDHKDLEALKLARQAADAAKVPVVLHLAPTFSSVKDIFALMRPGDVVTHVFREKHGILDENGKVLPETRELIARGVYLDIGHGGAHFSFETAERAMDQGVLPDTISTDLHMRIATQGPVFGLPTTLSKFLCLGMTLEQAIERGATTPGKIYGFGESLGTLQIGAPADVSIFDLSNDEIDFVDSRGQTRRGKRGLVVHRTIRGGKVCG